MTTRIMAAIVAAVIGCVVVCAGVVGALFTGGGAGASAGCAPPPEANPSTSASAPAVVLAPPAGGFPAIGSWDTDQVTAAAGIVGVGVRMGVPPRGWIIAVATAMQESGLRNLPGGDRDSVGLFQQRPSQGWGTREQLTDPTYAATKFYAKLLEIPGWQDMALTDAAQAVQRSATGQAYARWEHDAETLVGALTGLTGALAACLSNIGPQGWTQPVHGPLVSGFRTAERPDHNGVDLAVPKGTAVHAAASGTVTVMACNASTADGAAYSCDVDGSADIRGCGWYVDITHPGGIVTRYCHLLVHPAVQVGQHVLAGQVIGISGTSGNSSGPHLHFEVHDGDPLDPVPFMAAHGAALQ